LNTAFGTSVGPLPFHGMKRYPYAPDESYPADAAHKQFVKEYDTRFFPITGTANGAGHSRQSEEDPAKTVAKKK
jgi:hypothetical protein